MNLATEITATRKKLGLSGVAAAKAWGINPRTLQNWEQGRNLPRGLALTKLREILAQQPATTASKSSRTKG
ncbi:MAG: helix-turn-helix domain-containing protein [Verrucomicrobia bacterium]|nr:helix-turn-helix domain-containing protein [Verrucomicrobiota bacterium]